MKIFHCLRNFFPDHVGGTEIYVAALCHELRILGFEVAIVKPSFNKVPSNYIYDGIEVFEYLETSLATPLLQAGMMPPEGLSNFSRLLSDKKPDAVHFHETAGSSGITIYHLQAAFRMGFRLFTTFHLPGNICMRDTFLFKGKQACNGIINEQKCAICLLHKRGLTLGLAEVFASLGEQFQHEIVNKGIRKLLNYPLYVKKHKENLKKVSAFCEQVFVFSNWYKNLLLINSFNEQKIVVLPSSTSVSLPLEPQPERMRSKGSIVQLVYVGRIAEIKGLHILLQALSQTKLQNWHLDIYGNVSDKDYLKLCQRLGKNLQQISWKGHIAHQDIIATLVKYDALIFPSIAQETMGLVLMEAMAAKLPVIGSSIWTVEEKIMHNKTGLIFKSGSSKALKAILESVLSNPAVLTVLANNIVHNNFVISPTKQVANSYLQRVDKTCD